MPPSSDATGWRERIRRTRAGRLLLRAFVFAAGAFFVALGLVLVVLPGPLTIPPVLLGVYIWSTEFDWAERLRERAVSSALEAWAQATRRPAFSAVATASGIGLIGVGLFVGRRYEVIDRVTGVLG